MIAFLVILGLAVWFLVSIALALLIGKIIRRRDIEEGP